MFGKDTSRLSLTLLTVTIMGCCRSLSGAGMVILSLAMSSTMSSPGGLCYCINSPGLRFISKEDLEKEGYGQYLNSLLENEGKHPVRPARFMQRLGLISPKVFRITSLEFELQTEGHTFIPDEGLSRGRLVRGAISRLRIKSLGHQSKARVQGKGIFLV